MRYTEGKDLKAIDKIEELLKNGEYSKEDLEYLVKKMREEDKKEYGLMYETHVEDVELRLSKGEVYLEEDEELRIEEVEGGEIRNSIIEGDNLESLTYLKNEGDIFDVIYIDPPYSTGTKSWKYDDYFRDRSDVFIHSKWLSFMEKRLKIARELMVDDGLIFISIDDNEQAGLKLLCDSIFGRDNFVNNIVWYYENSTLKNPKKRLATTHEYVLVYTKNIKVFEMNKVRRGKVSENNLKRFGKYVDENMEIRLGDVEKEKSFKSIMVPRFKKKYGREPENDDVIYKLEPNYLRDVINVPTIKGNHFESRYDVSFSHPKNPELISILISLKDKEGEKMRILDFFAGSGSTGKAVLDYNLKNGTKHEFTLCNSDESGICREVLYERLKKDIKGYKTMRGVYNRGIPSSLRYFRTKIKGEEDEGVK